MILVNTGMKCVIYVVLSQRREYQIKPTQTGRHSSPEGHFVLLTENGKCYQHETHRFYLILINRKVGLPLITIRQICCHGDLLLIYCCHMLK